MNKGFSKVSRFGFAALFSLSLIMVSQSALAGPGKGHGQHGQHLAQMDSNKDGALSLAEMQQAALARFNAQDTNKDGFLTLEEIKAHWASKRAEKGKKAAPEKGAEKMAQHLQKRFEKQDTNKDQRISKAEVEAQVKAHFTAMDSNKDGLIKADEMKGHMKGKMKGKRGQRGQKGQNAS